MYIDFGTYIGIMIALGSGAIVMVVSALRINKLEKDVRRYRERIWALSKSNQIKKWGRKFCDLAHNLRRCPESPNFGFAIVVPIM